MSDMLAEVTGDLAAEHAALLAVLEKLGPDDWARPTHAPGWAVRDQVAHLAFFDGTATTAIVDPDRFVSEAAALNAEAAQGDPAYLTEARKLSVDKLFQHWKTSSERLVKAAHTLDATRRMPWYGPPMSAVSFITARLMECWSHGLDVVDVVDVVGAGRPATDRLRHVAHLGVRTRNFSYVARGLEPNTEPMRVELLAPSGELWVFGEPDAPNRIAGPAEDFCQVVTQRRHVADTALEVTGAAAEEWMRLAQAFAGPPGEGRKPGQFTKAHP